MPKVTLTLVKRFPTTQYSSDQAVQFSTPGDYDYTPDTAELYLEADRFFPREPGQKSGK